MRMTMNAELNAPAGPAGQSWCAGPMVRPITTRTAAPSWLAPHGFDDDDDTAIPSERPLLAIDVDGERLETLDAHDHAVEATRQSMLEIALLPPNTPVISVIPDPALEYPDLREENAELRRALEALTRELSRVRKETLEASEAELVRLACAVAERIVGQELSTDPGHIIGWAREGLAALDAKENVVVALAPDLAQAVPLEQWSALGGSAGVEIDPSLPAWSCEVRSRTAVATVSAVARMAQMKSELGAEGGSR
jgi:hypothetical protein